MERKYKITIPEPCQEDWNKMTPNKNGRFCGSCSKNVVDFTNKLPEEIQAYFLQHTNVCGRFKKSQLDSLTIQIPNRILFSQTQYHKMFLLALFVAMGTTLFSCADKNGNKQKIEKIEVVEDSFEVKGTITKEPTPNKKKTLNNTQIKPQIKKSITTTTKTSATEIPIIYEDNTIYGGIGFSIYPEYLGGIKNFNKYIKENFNFSKKSKHLNDTLIATFVIAKNGKLDSINVSKDLGFGTKEELIRILSDSKKWYPGEENGKKKNCKFQLFVTIKSDTIKKSFFRTKIIPKIDTIKLERISKFKND
ncbi:hypothetical protein [Flavobacterium marginilacus]|uniref:hypothetical protein n=1 Tax=Flavobacterium marginilacus TaxID=3003256 RepID=UPI00248EDC7F|nr:hypothetical protein [Flavobacterium marginilacus]